METRFTPSGVRLRLHSEHPGERDWLLLPGGPGIGSESLIELAEAMQVPGRIWLVDLPGDGSNGMAGSIDDPCFAHWPQVFLEAAGMLPGSVAIGHSTGGMYLLSIPELETCLSGLVLVSTAPDASWKPRYVAMTQADPLPAVDASAALYAESPGNERIRDLAVASAPWNFTAEGLAAGRDLLARMPYNFQAVEWSDRYFDDSYTANWWPGTLPVLILGGAEDRIVSQRGWDDPRFTGTNVVRTSVPGAGHFPWIEGPDAVGAAFAAFAARISGG
jgi:pimeloyl-ACP methyl ester carboxylesterase